MNRARVSALAALALLGLSWSSAHAGFYFGFGIPGPYYRPYYRPYYYGPRVVIGGPAVYVAPAAPVYVTPAPVYVTPAPAYAAPAQGTAPQPAQTLPAPTPAPVSSANLPPAPVPVGN